MAKMRTVTRKARDGSEVVAYKTRMRDGIEERVYPSGKRSFFVRVRWQGRQRPLRVKGAQTWANARAFKASVLTQMQGDDFIAPERQRITFAALSKRWLEAIEVSPESIPVYRGLLDNHLLPAFGSVQILRLSPEKIQQFKVEALRQDAAPSSVQARLRLLRQIMRWAVDNEILRKNPALKVPYPKPEKRTQITIYSPEQLRQLFDASIGYWRPMLIMAAMTGMRRGEIQVAKWADLDWEKGEYFVGETFSRFRTFKPPKTAASRATVDLSESVLEALTEQRARAAQMRLEATEWKELDLIFPTRTGRVISPGACSKALHKATDRAGLPRCRFHDLRHSFISLLIQQGVNIKIVQRKARHANISMTLDTYGHLFPQDTKEATVRLDERLFGSLG
jgi:integrase